MAEVARESVLPSVKRTWEVEKRLRLDWDGVQRKFFDDGVRAWASVGAGGWFTGGTSMHNVPSPAQGVLSGVTADVSARQQAERAAAARRSG